MIGWTRQIVSVCLSLCLLSLTATIYEMHRHIMGRILTAEIQASRFEGEHPRTIYTVAVGQHMSMGEDRITFVLQFTAMRKVAGLQDSRHFVCVWLGRSTLYVQLSLRRGPDIIASFRLHIVVISVLLKYIEMFR